MKAIFFDIDGTLVSLLTGKMMASTKVAVEQLRRKGIMCFVATGRSRPEIESMDMLEGVAFDGVLSSNGQYCYDGDKVLYDAPLDAEDVAAVVRQAEEVGYSIWVVESHRIYVNHVNDRTREAMRRIHTPVPEVADTHRALGQPVYKIVMYLTPEELQKYPMQATKICQVASWCDIGADLIAKDGGKLRAVQEMMRRYGLAVEDTMAFGDGENDIDMLRYVGTGVAMGNAARAVKQIASYTTARCEDDGIYRALVHFGLIEDVLHLGASAAP